MRSSRRWKCQRRILLLIILIPNHSHLENQHLQVSGTQYSQMYQHGIQVVSHLSQRLYWPQRERQPKNQEQLLVKPEVGINHKYLIRVIDPRRTQNKSERESPSSHYRHFRIINLKHPLHPIHHKYLTHLQSHQTTKMPLSTPI